MFSSAPGRDDRRADASWLPCSTPCGTPCGMPGVHAESLAQTLDMYRAMTKPDKGKDGEVLLLVFDVQCSFFIGFHQRLRRNPKLQAPSAVFCKNAPTPSPAPQAAPNCMPPSARPSSLQTCAPRYQRLKMAPAPAPKVHAPSTWLSIKQRRPVFLLSRVYAGVLFFHSICMFSRSHSQYPTTIWRM